MTSGWLAKKGHKRRNWKRRYFVLSDDWSTLSYFDDELQKAKMGEVALGGATCTLGLDYVPKRAHVFAFTVRARDDVYHLECASESERQRWLRTLRTAATRRRRRPGTRWCRRLLMLCPSASSWATRGCSIARGGSSR